MSRPRVLWLSSAFPPQVGGLQRYCDCVSRHLAGFVDLTVVTAPGQRASAHAPQVECPHLGGFHTEPESRVLRAALERIVHEARPDLIHLGHAQMAALRPLLPSAVPIVVSVHGNDLTSPWMRFGKDDIAASIRSGLRGCHLVCVSEHTASLVRSCAIEAPVTVVHNACDLDRFRRIEFDREAFLSRLGIPADVPLLLSVGRLAARKSHMTVMRALSHVTQPFHWLVIGEGGQRTALELARFFYRLRARVSLPGQLSEDDLVLGYNAADMFVLTPVERTVRGGVDSEGFGLVYHEAAACGTPSIASDVSGCREAVVHGRTGLLVPPGSPRQTAAAISRLITGASLRRSLGAGAEEHVRASGGWEAVCRKLVDIYEAALGGTEGVQARESGAAHA